MPACRAGLTLPLAPVRFQASPTPSFCPRPYYTPRQVAKAFVRLRNGLPAVTPDRAAAYAAAAAQPYHSFRGLPEEAWPLFLSGKQYLHMLDGEAQKTAFKGNSGVCG